MSVLMKAMAQRAMRALPAARAVVAGHRAAAAARAVLPRAGANAFATIAENYKYRTYDLFPPHGGVLKERMVTDAKAKAALIKSANHTITMNDRQMCDVELLMTGAFSPLEGFMNKKTYEHVVDTYRLPESNLIFGIPVVFDTNDEKIKVGDKILLKSKAGEDVAVLEVDDKYTPNKPKECKQVYGTSSIEHPGTLMVATERGQHYLGGKVHGLNIPKRPFPCKTPAQVRDSLPSKDGKHVVVFQCRNPIHRAHYELFMRAREADNVKRDGAIVLVHPTVGPTQADDISGEVRYLTYIVLDKQINDPTVRFEYLPYSMHMAGPREALMHMMIRKNYGCTHFIIGRDMAGSKSSLSGEDFYTPFEAQDLALKHKDELIDTVPSLNLVCTKEYGYIIAEEAAAKGVKALKLSGTVSEESPPEC
jgi:sulfate adenylyltransferase